MLVQQCYDEGVAEADERIKILVATISQRNGPACAQLAESYLDHTSRMEKDLARPLADIPGWISGELTLSLAKQRLRNVELIRDRCER
ncbi:MULTISPECIES: hypothetical protein [unclassified Caballeronia]|uniref:hypothetical protein n=1 Tax=unclassified Caballeronia TaxID=2646786 RepID=UPI0028664B69|nr:MULTISPECIES: hypothetical protein [unclassified Caballeronia]MDR5740358.1 hypothetical protein [Caballeronia sp. LZ016]MDR5808461.1 hypothetical protein [Caballeronia sp. LZ019]